jgi:hypothetical protein
MSDHTYCPHCGTLIVPILGRDLEFALAIHLEMIPSCRRDPET